MMKAQMGRERKTLWRQVDNTMMRHMNKTVRDHPLGALATSRWVSSGNTRTALKAAICLWRELRGWGILAASTCVVILSRTGKISGDPGRNVHALE